MRRYAVGRYLTVEQRERAAVAEYSQVEITNMCGRGCCHDEFVWAIRAIGTMSAPLPYVCPLGMALDTDDSPDAFEAESLLSTGRSPRVNLRRLKAIQDFIHAVDSGQIGTNDVAAALGVATTSTERAK